MAFTGKEFWVGICLVVAVGKFIQKWTKSCQGQLIIKLKGSAATLVFSLLLWHHYHPLTLLQCALKPLPCVIWVQKCSYSEGLISSSLDHDKQHLTTSITEEHLRPFTLRGILWWNIPTQISLVPHMPPAIHRQLSVLIPRCYATNSEVTDYSHLGT